MCVLNRQMINKILNLKTLKYIVSPINNTSYVQPFGKRSLLHIKKEFQFKTNVEKKFMLKLSLCSRCIKKRLLLPQAHSAIPSTIEVFYWLDLTVAVKQADRQASRILKMRSSKPNNFRIPVF